MDFSETPQDNIQLPKEVVSKEYDYGGDIRRLRVFKYPDIVRKEIDRLILQEGRGAKWVLDVCKAKFASKISSGELKLIGEQAMNRYVQWKKANPLVQNPCTPVPPVESTSTPATPESIGQSSESDALLVDIGSIDLNSGKETLDKLKVAIRNRILLIQKQQQQKFDKYNEGTLQKYFEALRQLVHSDVKLSTELKDLDSVTVAEVKASIHKLFTVVRLVVDKIMPEKKDLFLTELNLTLKEYQSKILEEQDYEPLDREDDTRPANNPQGNISEEQRAGDDKGNIC